MVQPYKQTIIKQSRTPKKKNQIFNSKHFLAKPSNVTNLVELLTQEHQNHKQQNIHQHNHHLEYLAMI